MLQDVQRQGITILVSTPYMDEATLCDRIALIMNGEILKIATPQQLVDQFNKTLFAVQSNEMHRLLNDLRKFPISNSCFAFGDTHHLNLPTGIEAQQQLKEYLLENGHQGIVINPIKASIEDCFMDLGIKTPTTNSN